MRKNGLTGQDGCGGHQREARGLGTPAGTEVENGGGDNAGECLRVHKRSPAPSIVELRNAVPKMHASHKARNHLSTSEGHRDRYDGGDKKRFDDALGVPVGELRDYTERECHGHALCAACVHSLQGHQRVRAPTSINIMGSKVAAGPCV